MSKVSLTPLAITDLSLRYARRLDGNKIRHYRVNAIQHLIPGLPGASNPVELVRSYIQKTEGPVVVEILDSPIPERFLKGGASLSVEDQSARVLEGLPGIKKAMLKLKVKNLLYQYNRVMSLRQMEGLNNYVYRDRQGNLQKNPKISLFKVVLNILADKLGLQKLIPERYSTSVRCVSPVSYLAYSYEENDESKAIQLLRDDLSTLHKRGLIQGHLSMPSTIYLADTVGAGVARKVLFCFLVVDLNKLYDQLNLNAIEAPRLPLKKLLGVKGETLEGGLGHEVSDSKYEIEEVDVDQQPGRDSGPVFGPNHEDANKEVIENYLQNAPFVNKVAAEMAKALKKDE